MKNHTRDLALIAMFSALLLGVQFVLSSVAGVELVSVTLLCFSAVFGIKRGVATALTFSLLRCIIWGAIPTVIVLYVIYFPLYALISALCGKIKGDARYYVSTAAATLMTVCFTLLDDVITPLMSGFNAGAWRAYFYASTPVMLMQTVNCLVTVLILFPPLTKLFEKLKIRYYNESIEA